jgi:hypothetical protein
MMEDRLAGDGETGGGAADRDDAKARRFRSVRAIG